MVNSDGEQFTMFAEPFLRLLNKPDEYALVKKMDKHPQQARGYHGGEILAQIDENDDDWVVTLYFGSLSQRMEFKEGHGPVNVLTSQEFNLPKSELESFRSSVEIMMEQTRKFDRMKMNADATPEWTFSSSDKKNNTP
jgi:hypothetical protein